MVAAQPTVGAVQNEPRVAVAALDRLAAVVAEHDRRESAAVDEEEGLLAALEPFADGLDEALGEAGRERQAPHVVERDPRHAGPAGALGEPQPPAPAGGAEVNGLQGGGRGAEHHRDPFHGAAHEGEVPGGVPESLLLLVGRVVLLVDDDEGRPAKGGEDGRAGSDDDAARAGARRLPAPQPFAVRHPGVDDRERDREGLPEPGDELRGESDLRHENEGLAGPGAEEAVDGDEVDLGLAAPRHPIEEKGAERAGRGLDGLGRLGLRLVRGRELRPGTGRGRGDRERLDPALLLERSQGRAPARNRAEPRLGERWLAAFPGRILERGDHRRLPGGAAEVTASPRRFGEAPGAGRGWRRRSGAPQADGKGGPDHLADRMVVVVRGPDQQAQQRRRNRRLVIEPLGDPAEPLGIDLGLVRRLENHPRAHRAAERDLHPHAGPQGAGTGRLVGRQVLEPAPDRPRHRDSEHPRHGRPVPRGRESGAGQGEMDSCPESLRPRHRTDLLLSAALPRRAGSGSAGRTCRAPQSRRSRCGASGRSR